MARAVGQPISAEDAKTSVMVDRLLYPSPAARRQRAEKEASSMALEYRQTRLDAHLDHDFRNEVEPLPGDDLIEKFVILCMFHDPDLFWLDDDVTLFEGIVAAIHVVARSRLWLNSPTHESILEEIQGKRSLWNPQIRGLDACRVIMEDQRAA